MIFLTSAALLFLMGPAASAEPTEIYIVPHFHWDLSYKQSEAIYEKMGNGLILDFLNQAEADPDFKFILDQVPLIEKFLEWKPGEVERMKRFIGEGRLEISGAMYVQPDVNLPSGESLIRQVLYGQRWLEETLDTRARYLWNIDSFGRLYQMPQIARGSGLEAAVWSYARTNINMPETTVYDWVSPDGSAVRSQVLYPHYNACEKLGRTNPYDKEREWELVQDMVDTFRAKEDRPRYMALCGSDFMPPAPTITELARDWNANHDDVKLIVAVPADFFEAEAADPAPLPRVEHTDYQVSWNGFFSNIIEDKLKNRVYENLLRQGEAVRTMAALHGLEYPQGKFEKLWIPLLANQFHDLMAGTTIDAGRPKFLKRFEFIGDKLPRLIFEAMNFLAKGMDTAAHAPQTANNALVVFNTLSFARRAVVRLPYASDDPISILDAAGTEITCQKIDDEIVFIADLPAMGWRTYYLAQYAPDTFNPLETNVESNSDSNFAYEPAHGGFRAVFDDQLNLVSLTGADSKDLASSPRPLNTLCLQPDTGDTYSYAPAASDHFEPMPERVCSNFEKFFTAREIVEGPLAVRIKVSGAFGDSAISREAWIYKDLPRIDITTTVDWKEINRDLHAVFPFNVDGVRTDSVPLGFMERGSQTGRFPIQNWTDFGDGDTGLTILTRGLSGLYTRDNMMFLGLVRSVSRIHSTAMLSARSHGRHTLQYALVPRSHALFESADPCGMGQDFNDDVPVAVTGIHGGDIQTEFSLLETSGGVAATALFMDADRIVLRLLETQGKQRIAKIKLNIPEVSSLKQVNFMLENPEEVPFSNQSFEYEFRPQQAQTFLMQSFVSP